MERDDAMKGGDDMEGSNAMEGDNQNQDANPDCMTGNEGLSLP